jgi:hypothetical protein
MHENTQQTQTQHFDRRASDHLPHITILLDIKSEVQAIRTELIEFKRDVNKAFPKDDEGLPDYDAHRRKHLRDIKEEDKFAEYKTDFSKKLFSWLGIGTVGFVLAAVVSYIKGGNL